MSVPIINIISLVYPPPSLIVPTIVDYDLKVGIEDLDNVEVEVAVHVASAAGRKQTNKKKKQSSTFPQKT